jgi:hypothetical protein
MSKDCLLFPTSESKHVSLFPLCVPEKYLLLAAAADLYTMERSERGKRVRTGKDM